MQAKTQVGNPPVAKRESTVSVVYRNSNSPREKDQAAAGMASAQPAAPLQTSEPAREASFNVQPVQQKPVRDLIKEEQLSIRKKVAKDMPLQKMILGSNRQTTVE